LHWARQGLLTDNPAPIEQLAFEKNQRIINENRHYTHGKHRKAKRLHSRNHKPNRFEWVTNGTSTGIGMPADSNAIWPGGRKEIDNNGTYRIVRGL